MECHNALWKDDGKQTGHNQTLVILSPYPIIGIIQQIVLQPVFFRENNLNFVWNRFSTGAMKCTKNFFYWSDEVYKIWHWYLKLGYHAYDNKWIQYKIRLVTSQHSATPSVKDKTVTFDISTLCSRVYDTNKCLWTRWSTEICKATFMKHLSRCMYRLCTSVMFQVQTETAGVQTETAGDQTIKLPI